MFNLHPKPAAMTDGSPANIGAICMKVLCRMGCGIGGGTSSFVWGSVNKHNGIPPDVALHLFQTPPWCEWPSNETVAVDETRWPNR